MPERAAERIPGPPAEIKPGHTLILYPDGSHKWHKLDPTLFPDEEEETHA